jgi:hypothetical protein
MIETNVQRRAHKTILISFTESRDHDLESIVHLSQKQAEKLCDTLTGLLQDMITEDERD